MEQKRILKGNNTVLPLGTEILGAYATNAVTDHSIPQKGRRPDLSNMQSVIDAREWNMQSEL